LFVGDGHAAQGDGELTGDALETSMDIEFTVDVIAGKNFGHPLAENAEFLISIGIGGTIDQALQQATSGMVRWLDRDYGLNANEAAIGPRLCRQVRRRRSGRNAGQRCGQGAQGGAGEDGQEAGLMYSEDSILPP
jgi:acetamidase/formamidase